MLCDQVQSITNKKHRVIGFNFAPSYPPSSLISLPKKKIKFKLISILRNVWNWEINRSITTKNISRTLFCLSVDEFQMNGTSLWQRHNDCHFQSLAHRFEIISQITGRCSRKMCNRFLIEWSSIKGFNQLTFFPLPASLERHPTKFLFMYHRRNLHETWVLSNIYVCSHRIDIPRDKAKYVQRVEECKKIFHSGAKDFLLISFPLLFQMLLIILHEFYYIWLFMEVFFAWFFSLKFSREYLFDYVKFY